MLPEAYHRQYSKKKHFQYGRREKMQKNKKKEFP